MEHSEIVNIVKAGEVCISEECNKITANCGSYETNDNCRILLDDVN